MYVVNAVLALTSTEGANDGATACKAAIAKKQRLHACRRRRGRRAVD